MMKTKGQRILFILLLTGAAATFADCTNVGDSTENPIICITDSLVNAKGIAGKWQLLEKIDGKDTVDYSADSILFDFSDNEYEYTYRMDGDYKYYDYFTKGTVEISSKHLLFPNGEYKYEYGLYEYGLLTLPCGYQLTIDEIITLGCGNIKDIYMETQCFDKNTARYGIYKFVNIK